MPKNRKQSPGWSIGNMPKFNPENVADVEASNAKGLDDGACDRCDGSGHDQMRDGQLCTKCGGTGRLDDFGDEE